MGRAINGDLACARGFQRGFSWSRSDGVDCAHRQRDLPVLWSAVPAGDGALEPARAQGKAHRCAQQAVPRMEMREIMDALGEASESAVLAALRACSRT